MNKEQVEARIVQITSEITQAVASHAKLVGHLNEAQHWLAAITKIADVIESSIDPKKAQVDGDPDCDCPE